MKRFFVLLTGIFVATAALGVMPVSAGLKDNMGNYLFKRKAIKAIESYTDNTVLKTIDECVNNIEKLHQAALKLQKNKHESSLAATTNAWHKVLSSLNRSTIFFYGPVAHYDYNKALALNPFDKILVDHALGEMKAGTLSLSSQVLRDKTASMRGLYTIRYLLYRNGLPRKVADITDAELSYLVVASYAMVEESIDLQASWVGTANLSADKVAILKKAGMKSHTSYAEEFKNPGEPYSRYLCVSVPLQEMIQESTSVIEDMIPGIEELINHDESDIKYWDSLDPYTELLDMLKGVENSYLGGVSGARGTSFSELVAEKDKVLDDRIKTAFAHTAKRILVIRDLKDASKEKREMAVKVAAAECEKLASRMMVATPLVTADPAVEPFGPYGSDL
jgi:predicted lipoprotein